MRLCAYVCISASVFDSVCVSVLASLCVCVMVNNNGHFTLVVVLVAAA